jgi:hypothetical protein
MRVLNIVSADSTWLFDLADLNPKGKSVFPEIIDWLKDTYNFKEAPTTAADLESGKGLVFKDGQFQAREEVFVDVQLSIFNDGLVAKSSSSTEDTDKFLESVVNSVVIEFNLAFDPNMIRKRIYLSQLNVRFETPLGNVNPRLGEFAQDLTAMCPGHPTFEVGGLSFWTDGTVQATKTAPFIIERRLNAPFNENRFFSKAPLQTEQHIAMLTKLEGILKA